MEGEDVRLARQHNVGDGAVDAAEELVPDPVFRLKGDAVVFLEIPGSLQPGGADDHVPVRGEEGQEVEEPAVHAKGLDGGAGVHLRDPLSLPLRAVQPEQVERRGAEDADGVDSEPVPFRRFPPEFFTEFGGLRETLRFKDGVERSFLQRFDEGHVSELRALVVVLHAVGLDGQSREAELLLAHAGEGFEVGAHDGRDRGPDEGDEVRVPDRFHGAADFVDGPFIAAEDGVQVPDARRVYGALLVAPPRLIEAADVARTAAGVQDDDDAAELVEHGHGTGLVRGKGAQVSVKAFHSLASLSSGFSLSTRSSSSSRPSTAV